MKTCWREHIAARVPGTESPRGGEPVRATAVTLHAASEISSSYVSCCIALDVSDFGVF